MPWRWLCPHTPGALLPAGLFDNAPQSAPTTSPITADTLTYDADAHQVTADGRCRARLSTASTMIGDHLVFDQQAHTAHFVGNVVINAPDGTTYTAPDVQLTRRNAATR